jgi:hypothetical protein
MIKINYKFITYYRYGLYSKMESTFVMYEVVQKECSHLNSQLVFLFLMIPILHIHTYVV